MRRVLVWVLLLATFEVAGAAMLPEPGYSQEAINFVPDASSAPSFDCGRARSRVERLICSSPDLSRKDRAVAQAYALAQTANPGEASDARQAQLTWWKQREACANSGTAILTCVENAYSARLSELGGAAQSIRDQGSIATAAAAPSPDQPASSSLDAHWRPDPRGVQFLKRLVENDADTYVAGGRSFINWSKAPELMPPPSEFSISAIELWRAYEANQIAADAKFKGKWLNISGNITHIRKDSATDTPYVELVSSPYGMTDVKAYLADDMIEEASAFKPMQQVSLLCFDTGLELMAPTLRDCRSPQAVRGSVDKFLDGQIEGWIYGRSQPTFLSSTQDREWLFSIYWIGSQLPSNSPCSISFSQDGCAGVFSQIRHLNSNMAFITAYYAAEGALHLPDARSLSAEGSKFELGKPMR